MRHWLYAGVLCGIAVAAAAEAPLPKAATEAPADRPAAAAPKLVLAATPTQETGGVSAPLPRGNPGDPLARQARERADDDDARSAAVGGARRSDLEAKEGAASASPRGSRDTEDK